MHKPNRPELKGACHFVDDESKHTSWTMRKRLVFLSENENYDETPIWIKTVVSYATFFYVNPWCIYECTRMNNYVFAGSRFWTDKLSTKTIRIVSQHIIMFCGHYAVCIVQYDHGQRQFSLNLTMVLRSKNFRVKLSILLS